MYREIRTLNLCHPEREEAQLVHGMEINTHAQVESAPSQNMATGALVCVERVAAVGHFFVVTVVCTGGAWNTINAVQTTASSVQNVFFHSLDLVVLDTDVKYMT